jgi:lactoylglutathione lyase
MIKGISHAAFRVGDMTASLKFYCEVLGFKKAFELSKPDGSPGLIYIKVREGQFIELFYGKEGDETHAQNGIGYTHLCLEVEDIEQFASHLRTHGIEITAGPKQGRDTNWQCWAKDPDGNRIEFMQMNPESPQMRS